MRALRLFLQARALMKQREQKICARLFQCHVAQIYGLSQTLYIMAEGTAISL